jgi:N-methylhydantoinase B
MGLRRVYRAEADCRVRLIGSRLLTAPWGLAGAHPGGIASFRLSEGAAPLERGAGDLKKGDIVEIVTAGAGGYGRPELRAASAIGRDVIEGRISPQLARTVYGR